jgi:steroid delta-isomerase-like uncharacterized protein
MVYDNESGEQKSKPYTHSPPQAAIAPDPALAALREELVSFPPNLDSIRHFLAMLRPAFPDMQVQAESAAIDGDTIVLTTTWRGTHTGAFVGLPATGRRVEFQSVDMVRVVNGKIREQRGHVDYVGLLRQLGLVSASSE